MKLTILDSRVRAKTILEPESGGGVQPGFDSKRDLSHLSESCQKFSSGPVVWSTVDDVSLWVSIIERVALVEIGSGFQRCVRAKMAGPLEAVEQ